MRPEDALDNLAHERPRELAVFVAGEVVFAEIVDVADSTCVRAFVTLPEGGTHRVRVVDKATGAEATTNPIPYHASLARRLATLRPALASTPVVTSVQTVPPSCRSRRLGSSCRNW